MCFHVYLKLQIFFIGICTKNNKSQFTTYLKNASSHTGQVVVSVPMYVCIALRSSCGSTSLEHLMYTMLTTRDVRAHSVL